MSYEFYKLLHFLGLFLAFTALGGQMFYVINGGTKDAAQSRGLIAAGHGLGLVLVLVAGFGMQAKLGIEGMPGWFLAKIGIWVALGAWLALPWRAPHLAKPLWFVLPLLGAVAAWLAIFKPF